MFQTREEIYQNATCTQGAILRSCYTVSFVISERGIALVVDSAEACCTAVGTGSFCPGGERAQGAYLGQKADMKDLFTSSKDEGEEDNGYIRKIQRNTKQDTAVLNLLRAETTAAADAFSNPG